MGLRAWLRLVATHSRMPGCWSTIRSSSPPTYPAAPITATRISALPGDRGGQRVAHRRDQARRVAQRVVGREPELTRDVVAADLVVGGRPGETGDRQLIEGGEELVRSPARHRVRRRDDVG